MALLSFAALAGCTERPVAVRRTKFEPRPSSQPVSESVEAVVRDVIAQLLGVRGASIDMNRPLSQPPLNADELDLVEIVMELEERLGVEIGDDALERHAGKSGKGVVTPVTPSQLVSIAREARQAKAARK